LPLFKFTSFEKLGQMMLAKALEIDQGLPIKAENGT
jgi:hypothetical protein